MEKNEFTYRKLLLGHPVVVCLLHSSLIVCCYTSLIETVYSEQVKATHKSNNNSTLEKRKFYDISNLWKFKKLSENMMFVTFYSRNTNFRYFWTYSQYGMKWRSVTTIKSHACIRAQTMFSASHSNLVLASLLKYERRKWS